MLALDEAHDLPPAAAQAVRVAMEALAALLTSASKATLAAVEACALWGDGRALRTLTAAHRNLEKPWAVAALGLALDMLEAHDGDWLENVVDMGGEPAAAVGEMVDAAIAGMAEMLGDERAKPVTDAELALMRVAESVSADSNFKARAVTAMAPRLTAMLAGRNSAWDAWIAAGGGLEGGASDTNESKRVLVLLGTLASLHSGGTDLLDAMMKELRSAREFEQCELHLEQLVAYGEEGSVETEDEELLRELVSELGGRRGEVQ